MEALSIKKKESLIIYLLENDIFELAFIEEYKNGKTNYELLVKAPIGCFSNGRNEINLRLTEDDYVNVVYGLDDDLSLTILSNRLMNTKYIDYSCLSEMYKDISVTRLPVTEIISDTQKFVQNENLDFAYLEKKDYKHRYIIFNKMMNPDYCIPKEQYGDILIESEEKIESKEQMAAILTSKIIHGYLDKSKFQKLLYLTEEHAHIMKDYETIKEEDIQINAKKNGDSVSVYNGKFRDLKFKMFFSKRESSSDDEYELWDIRTDTGINNKKVIHKFVVACEKYDAEQQRELSKNIYIDTMGIGIKR